MQRMIFEIGDVFCQKDDIEGEVLNYFQQIFISSHLEEVEFEAIQVAKKVSLDMSN